MSAVPAFVVEYFLLGSTGVETVDRFTQDGGVAADVWLAYAEDRKIRLRVLLSATQGISTTTLAARLHNRIAARRKGHPEPRTGVSALDSYAVANVTFEELVHVVLPMTVWWKQYKLPEIRNLIDHERLLVKEAVIANLTGIQCADFMKAYDEGLQGLAKQLYEAAPVLALIGVFIAADRGEIDFSDFPSSSRDPSFKGNFGKWMLDSAENIAEAVFQELLVRPLTHVSSPVKSATRRALREASEDQQLIQRVFLDRAAAFADFEALGTIKADAATRVFDVSCRSLTWAVIDAGIDGSHPAFEDHDAPLAQWSTLGKPPSRIRRTFDFTKIEVIRGYDLTTGPVHSPERNAEVQRVIEDLMAVSGREDSEDFREMAHENLQLIASQLENELTPDWKLIEPLIELRNPDPTYLTSDHGTHVAGILGADWRDKTLGNEGKKKLLGVCPDINVYDLRVLASGDLEGLESAVISALDFVRYLNAKGQNETVVAGVNISMSIPYNPGMYGCGVTPVCVASDRLSDSGVVVVAAAGNRGWSQQATSMGKEMVFGQALFSTVTDPGNAHQVITVGSTHRLKPHLHGVSFFSGRGPTIDGRLKPDLVAPGEKIRGPVPGQDQRPKDGTSMAAPFVSGAAAMLLARHKELMGNPQRVKQILCATATDLGRERYFQGNGLVDVLRALQSI